MIRPERIRTTAESVARSSEILDTWHDVEVETAGALPTEELVAEVAQRVGASIEEVLDALETMIEKGRQTKH